MNAGRTGYSCRRSNISGGSDGQVFDRSRQGCGKKRRAVGDLFRSRWAFTLIELLTVIAIVGILAAILIPSAAGARVAANKAKTRAQFAQWTAALEAFRQEYGAYPQFFDEGLINHAASTVAGEEHLFHDILAGRRRDPTGAWGEAGARTPALPQTQNPRRLAFFTFSESDFVSAADVAGGLHELGQLNLLRDAFRNTSIAVVVDRNLDGVINGADFPSGVPHVFPPDGGPALAPPEADLPSGSAGGVHAGVIFYSAPPKAAPDGSDLIKSWK